MKKYMTLELTEQILQSLVAITLFGGGYHTSCLEGQSNLKIYNRNIKNTTKKEVKIG